jgi:hypothetical protein
MTPSATPENYTTLTDVTQSSPEAAEETTTMKLGFGSFAIGIHRHALDIRMGTYDLSWDRNGLCICKGMETLWANWE